MLLYRDGERGFGWLGSRSSCQRSRKQGLAISLGQFGGANARLVCNDLGRRRLNLLLLFFGRHVWSWGEMEGDMVAYWEAGSRVDWAMQNRVALWAPYKV